MRPTRMTALETARLLYAQYDEASDHKTVLGAAMMCASHLPALIEQAEQDRRDVIAAEAREERNVLYFKARADRAEASLDRLRNVLEAAGQSGLWSAAMGRADD